MGCKLFGEIVFRNVSTSSNFFPGSGISVADFVLEIRLEHPQKDRRHHGEKSFGDEQPLVFHN
jgi:hypothetical protein